MAVGGCDIRIASTKATMGFTFNRLGLHPGMVCTFLHFVWFHEIFIFPFLGQLSQEDEDDVLKELDDLIGSEENISELPEVPTNGN